MEIRVEGLAHHYADNGSALWALRDVAFQVEPGEFVAIVGRSGCGKSTLLRILAGLTRPSRGTVLLGGMTARQARAEKQMAWMAQSPALLPWKRVSDNVALAQRVNPRPERRAPDVDSLLRLVGLESFSQAYPAALSGGMQQRAALARTLALGASVWLMDEPFASLDALTREELTADLLGLWQAFAPTALWVTHDIYEAVRLADRVLVLGSRPGTLQAEVAVRLPRPRDETDPAFVLTVRQIRRALEAAE